MSVPNDRIACVCFGNEESYGLIFVGGELKRLGRDFRFFDAEAVDAARAVLDWGAGYAFFSPLTTFFPWALDVARTLKAERPGLITVFGGYHATYQPDIAGLEGVDAVVAGPVRGSLERIFAGERGLIRSEPTTPADLPVPAREEFFRDIPRIAGRYRKIMLSRLGCPWTCTYCASAATHVRALFGPAAHKRYFLARRPLEAILDEARVLLRYRTREIEWVDDDMFCGADADAWLPAFAEAWRREIGLPMYISTTSAMALRVSDEVLRSLRPIVNVIGMGIQAARPESLKIMGRAWDNEARMKAAYNRLASFGYAVNLQGIVGLPVDDPLEDALDTVKAMQRIGPGSVVSVYPLMIYPGTAMERLVREHGLALNPDCNGDTNSGIPQILFDPVTVKRLRNLCKLATLFVKFNVDERWMRPLLDVDFNEPTSRALSMVRYYECVTDRLKDEGRRIFDEIVAGMKLRF